MNALSAFECVAIQEENVKLRAELDTLKSDRRVLQAKGEHDAPCARFCESNAYEIAERFYKSQIEKFRSERDALLKERADPRMWKCADCVERMKIE